MAGVPDQNNNSSVAANVPVPDQCIVREQDRFMPIANVIRIMRKILPPHAKISDDAKETIQECVSEYISFVTGEANERCQREQRKTITAEDVLWAMSKLGFDDYIQPLTLYLHRYREFDGAASHLHPPLMVKRPAVDPPPAGPSAFHLPPPPPPPSHHRPAAAASASFYGPLAINGGGGGFRHMKGGACTSNGCDDPLAPNPEE